MTSYFYSAFVKVVLISLLIALWPLAQPYADPIKLTGQAYLAEFLYPTLPYSLFQSAQQVAIFCMGFELLLWIFAPKALDKSQTSFAANHTQNA